MSPLRDLLSSVQLKRSDKDASKCDLVKSDKVPKRKASAASAVIKDVSTSLLKDKSAANRVFKTVCLFYSALTLGLSTPLLGNTLVQLELYFNASTSQLSIALTVLAVGGLCGAIICGLIFDHVNQEAAFAIASLLHGGSYILAPHMGGLVVFIAAVFFMSSTAGFIFTGGQSYCVELWRGHRYRNPLLHCWHAVWSLGAMLGPLIIATFLVERPPQYQHKPAPTVRLWMTSFNFDDYRYDETGQPSHRMLPDEQTTVSPSWNLMSVNTTALPSDIYVSGVHRVRYAYVTMGSLALLAHLLFFFAFLLPFFKTCKQGSSERLLSSTSSSISSTSSSSSISGEATEKSSSCSESTADTPIGGEDSKRLDRFLYLLFIVQVFLFFHMYGNAITIPHMYMPAFVIMYLNFPVRKAALLMTLFFGFQFTARVISIPVAAFVRPLKILIFNVTSAVVFFVLLLALVNVWPTIIFITAPLASFSLATTSASATLWISDRVMINGRMSAIILAGVASGGFTGPLIVGQLFETSTPMWFAYVLAAASIAQAVLLFLLMVYDDRYGKRVTKHDNASSYGNDDKAVESSKNGGYKSISEREIRLELDPRVELSKFEGLPSTQNTNSEK